MRHTGALTRGGPYLLGDAITVTHPEDTRLAIEVSLAASLWGFPFLKHLEDWPLNFLNLKCYWYSILCQKKGDGVWGQQRAWWVPVGGWSPAWQLLADKWTHHAERQGSWGHIGRRDLGDSVLFCWRIISPHGMSFFHYYYSGWETDGQIINPRNNY